MGKASNLPGTITFAKTFAGAADWIRQNRDAKDYFLWVEAFDPHEPFFTQQTFKNLSGQGRVSEEVLKKSLREVRLALLEADVNFQVAKDFVADVRERVVGQKVIESVEPR